MRRIALRLAYDGTNFAGWQVQRSERTVQAELETALQRVCRSPVKLIASGRTDSGVHAVGQVCHFETGDEGPPGSKFYLALNRHLPADVRALGSAEVREDFHARYDAKQREYRYYLLKGRAATPFQRPYCYALASLPPLRLLNRYTLPLTGRHDFSSFAAEKDENENKVRRLSACVFVQEGPYTVLHISGDAFLWKMVRTIVGTILECAGRKADSDELREIMGKRDRKCAGTTAPSRGLFLHRVRYDERIFA